MTLIITLVLITVTKLVFVHFEVLYTVGPYTAYSCKLQSGTYALLFRIISPAPELQINADIKFHIKWY